jgi:hypothetical protein
MVPFRLSQAVTSAMSPEAVAGAAAMAKDAASRFSAAAPAPAAAPDATAEGGVDKRSPTAEDSDKAAKARAGKQKTDKS